MSNQEIGVESIFSTRLFSAGLNRYLAGLSQARTETAATAAALTSFGALITQTLGNSLTTARANAVAINQVAAALRAAATASQGAAQRASQASAAARAAANSATVAARAAGTSTVSRGGGRRGGNAANAALTASQQAAAGAIQRHTAAQRGLASAVQKSTFNIKGMTTASATLAVTVGTLAAGAIQSAIGAFLGFGRTIIETTTFFEKMDLATQFFVARNAQATNALLTYDQALAQTAKEAQALNYWQTQIAINSPFTTRDISTIFRTAQAYGLTLHEAEQLIPLMVDMASAVGLTSDVLERQALAFGQVRSRGKLTGEEIRQLGNSGIPVRDILVKELGILNSEFDELVESGSLTSDVVLPILIKSMKQFEGQAERIAFGSIGGIVSAFEELQEISTSTFFRGVLAPLIEDFNAFFKAANQPETLAFLKLLGSELGGNLKNAVRGTVGAVQGLIKQFQELDPAVKNQILTFGAVFALVISLAGALGILTLAFNLLMNPVIATATVVAFFVSEYSSGFAALDKVTGGFITSVGNMAVGVGKGIEATVKVVGAGVKGIRDFFDDLGDDLETFGRNAIESFGVGAIGAVSSLLPIFAEISSLFTFWLAPGSPPKVAPDIDDYARDTMGVYAQGLSEVSFGPAFKSIGNQLNEATRGLMTQVEGQGFATMDAYAQAVSEADLTGPLQKATSRIPTVLADTVKEGAEKADFGSIGVEVSQEFVDGFIDTLPVLIPAMAAELRELLDRIGRGRQLSLGGALAMNTFLKGFNEADFGVLDTASGVVRDVLQVLVDIGELDELDMNRLLFGANEDIAKAIGEFKELGSISQSTLDQLRRSAGRAGDFVVDLLVNYQGLSKATEAAEVAQKNLNAITEKYSDILDPLQKQLDAINERVTVADEEERILSLRRIINNEAVSGRRKQNAADQIQQILAERRVRNLEDERETAEDAAEKTLKARQKERDELEKTFAAIQAGIDAQLSQLGLVGQEGAIIKDLQEEVAKLREKEKTELELQAEMLRLQHEELGDLAKAAKAKLVLDDATSSEYERQQALLDLQEVAISRRNRLLEAAKFGIPESELTKLRDIIPTMDDLGIKEGKQKFESELSGLQAQLVDVEGITNRIEEATAEVKKRWEETKIQIAETFATMNENLPGFLKFFPDQETGEIPILHNLKLLAEGIAILGGAMVAWKIVATLNSFGLALAGLFGVVSGAGAATGMAGAAGAAAGGAAGAAGGIIFLAQAVTALGLAAGTTYVALLTLKGLIDTFTANQNERFAVNSKEIDDALGETKAPLQGAIDTLLTQVKPSPEARGALAQTIIDAFTLSSQEATDFGFGDQHIVESINNALNRALIEGLVADTPENRAAIAAFNTQVANLLKTTPTGAEKGSLTVLDSTQLTIATPEQEAQAKIDYAKFLEGITGDKTVQGGFATNMTSLIRDAVTLGMTDAQIETLVFGAFQEGVAAGLTKDNPENRKAVKTFIDTLVTQFREEGKIDSPSKLTEEEVGVPLGEGIIAGILKAIGVDAQGKSPLATALEKLVTQTSTASTRIKETLVTAFGAARKNTTEDAEAIKTDVSADFEALHDTLKIGSTAFKMRLALDWSANKKASTDASESIKTEVLADFTTLNTEMVPLLNALQLAVTTTFQTMQTDTQAAADLMRTGITATLVGEEDSLLADIRLGLLGERGLVPLTIGQTFMQMLGAGILAGKEGLAADMASAFSFALGQQSLAANPQLGAAKLVTGSRPSQSLVAGGTVNNRINNYYLTVVSSASSQGVINDFGIMETMAGA